MFYIKDFITEILRGKTLGRILLNWEIKKQTVGIKGDVLDLAGGSGASYKRYIPVETNLLLTDYKQFSNKSNELIDLNYSLPYSDKSWTNIFFFGAIYILEDSATTLKELKRIRSDEGIILLSQPFISGEIPEPHDYLRFTAEGLSKQLSLAGFIDFDIIRLGGRFSAAANLLHSAYCFNIIRLFIYSLSMLADWLLRSWEVKHPCPITYFCVIRK